ncbi:unnamed protein product [Cuscuta campestris]|uniref:Leucine-rich repeat-containing N-terminal plant-type domain-containing protein n=1 Tax=Cuscuta campestris TaxID=132261 RepID=A0A484K2E9_9ASTE|nr:unnamed protein product [Cuscuta campestris]
MSVGELSSLTVLRLFNNKLEGPIPSSLRKLSNLRHLDLSSNRLNGSIPSSVGKLVHLTRLELSDNNLSGPVPFSFGELSSLVLLDVSSNNLSGMLSETHFTNHTSLAYFEAQGNSLSLKVDPNWIPPFQLEVLYLGSCQLGPLFPLWVFTQKNLGYLDISNSGIEGNLPHRFWSFASQLLVVNISHNRICGEMPNLTEAPFRASLDFSWNRFSGPLPRVSHNITRLDFSSNGLSGTIFQFLCEQRDGAKGLKILNLRSNSLSGEIPDCWTSWGLLEALYLENNKFIGHFPSSIGSLSNLQSLHLRKNNFSGTLPASLGNCNRLVSLDVSENRFSGNIPSWIGESFSSMLLLNLRSNELVGPLPRQLCHLDALQILDLASNNLSGTIPGCFGDFSAMVTVDYSTGNDIYDFVDFTGGIMEDTILMYKGGGKEFDRTLNLVRIMDLSDNNFSGEIPEELTKLKALQSLNLSHNRLAGNLPEKMDIMNSLEVIDLSANQLSGGIPSGFSRLNFLSYLNLSDNRLTGQIPSSTQLQSFNASSYAGNRLCGPPLSRCSVPAPDDGTRGNHDDDDDDEHERDVKWLSISIALGFVMGFCGFIAPLCFSRRWNHRYNLLLDHLVNKICCFLKSLCPSTVIVVP